MITDWHAIAGITAGIVQAVSIIPYIWSMIRGTTRPNIVSWSLWTLEQIIAVAALWSAGASWPIIILVAATFNTALVLVLCLFGYGYKHFGLLDGVCLVLALAALGLWYITSDPLIALVLSVAADFSATLPTIAKVWKEPGSELAWSWLMVVAAGALALIATTKLDVANLIWPIYFVLAGGVVTGLIFWRQSLHKVSNKIT